MRFFVLMICIVLAAIGCKKNKPAADASKIPKVFQVKKADKKSIPTVQKEADKAPSKAKVQPDKPVITPDETPFGAVVLVNENSRFAVVKFAFGPIPPVGRRIFAYRDGLKVAELKVTGPQRDDNTVADILTGDVKVKDEVKVE